MFIRRSKWVLTKLAVFTYVLSMYYYWHFEICLSFVSKKKFVCFFIFNLLHCLTHKFYVKHFVFYILALIYLSIFDIFKRERFYFLCLLVFYITWVYINSAQNNYCIFHFNSKHLTLLLNLNLWAHKMFLIKFEEH